MDTEILVFLIFVFFTGAIIFTLREEWWKAAGFYAMFIPLLEYFGI